MSEAFKEIVEAMLRHPTRALATAFGVFWGIFMLTLLLGAGTGLRNGLYHLYEGVAVNAVWIYGSRTTLAFEGLGEGREILIDLDDLQRIERAIPELADLTPRAELRGVSVRHGARSAALPVYGVFPSLSQVGKLRAVRGRLLNALDLEQGRGVAMIGDRATKLLFGGADPIGSELRVGNVSLTVVGEYFDAGPENERRHVYIPFTTLQRSFTGSNKLELLIGTLREGASSERVAQRVRHLLAHRHRFDPKEQGLELWFMSDEFKRLKRLMLGIDAAIAAVGLGTLISGMVGVSNILFVSVRERAQEFGVRRALGATARSILSMVITEALILALVAGGVGLAAGLGMIQLLVSLQLESDFFRAPHVDASAALIALSILVVTSLIAGYFPAREAARMSPIDALRRE